MDRDVVALLGFVGMFALMAIRVPIGIAMGIAGVGGFALLSGTKPALNLLANVPLSVLTDYNLSVIPMFILMGAFASHSGMSAELFAAGRAWLHHRRGGLALASVAACGGFSAINGSSVATAATMTQVALPEMRRAGYEPGISAGLIAAGGTLGIMIPPSVILVLYGIMTEVDITALFAAGVIPGLMAVVFYSVVVAIIARVKPEWMPRGERHGWAERFASLKPLWAVVVLFVFVLGGIYGGLFTVQEGAGVGAIGTLLIGLLRGRLGWKQVKAALQVALALPAARGLAVMRDAQLHVRSGQCQLPQPILDACMRLCAMVAVIVGDQGAPEPKVGFLFVLRQIGGDYDIVINSHAHRITSSRFSGIAHNFRTIPHTVG